MRFEPPTQLHGAQIHAPHDDALSGSLASNRTVVRFAEWRTELPLEDRPWLTALRSPGVVAWSLYLLIAAEVAFAGYSLDHRDLFGFAMFGTFLTGFLILVNRAGRQVQRDLAVAKRLEAERDDDGVPQHRVKAIIECQEHTIDVDYGLVSMSGGWVYFAGERTDFSFSPRGARLLSPYEPGPRFQFRRYGLDFSVTFVSQSEKLGYRQMGEELREFERTQENAHGIEVLPPTRPSPDAGTRVRLVAARRTVAAVGAILLVEFFVLGLWLRSGFFPDEGYANTIFVTLCLMVIALALIFQSKSRKLRIIRELIEVDERLGVHPSDGHLPA